MKDKFGAELVPGDTVVCLCYESTMSRTTKMWLEKGTVLKFTPQYVFIITEDKKELRKSSCYVAKIA